MRREPLTLANHKMRYFDVLDFCQMPRFNNFRIYGNVDPSRMSSCPKKQRKKLSRHAAIMPEFLGCCQRVAVIYGMLPR